jgi:hypothetical protein
LFGDGCADALGRAGDDGDLARQFMLFQFQFQFSGLGDVLLLKQ